MVGNMANGLEVYFLSKDRISDLYKGITGDPISRNLARKRIEWICSKVKGKKILDIGCSQGVISILLGTRGYECVGIDIAQEAILYAQNDLERQNDQVKKLVEFKVMNAENIQYDDETFDTIILGEIIEHLYNPENVLKEVRRVLKPEGIVIITTPFGFLPDDDHKRTYYLSNFFEEVNKFFHRREFHILDNHFIAYVGNKNDNGSSQVDMLNDIKDLLMTSELSFFIKEKNLYSKIYNLRQQLQEAQLKYRILTENYDNLKTKFNTLCESHKNLSDQYEEITLERRNERLELKKLRIEIEELRKDQMKMDMETARLYKKLQDLEAEKNKMQSEEKELKNKIAQLEKELNDANIENNELNKKLKNLEEEKNRILCEKQYLDKELEKINTRTQELIKENAELKVYYKKYINAVKSFQHERNKLINNEKELSKLKHKLNVIHKSKAWKMVRRYWRFRREFINGSWKQRKLYILDISKKILSRIFNKDTGNNDKFKKKMFKYLEQVVNSKSKYFVFMFSGTTYVQEERGNRPIRQTKALLQMGVPVFFSYWRWNKDEDIPNYPDKRLFQSPIDKTLEYLNEIIKYDFKDKKKIFVVSFPHPSMVKVINLLNAYGWATIYDVRDDWEEFHKVGQAKWFDKNVEKYIVNNCDVVCTVSRPLQEKIQQYTSNKKVRLSPNALDSKFLTNGKVTISPRDGKPIIGYVGHLTSSWFDWESLINIANLKPEWIFEIIGHHIPKDLKLPTNIKYLGPKNYNQIKEIAKEWRVAIIPFKIGRLSDGVDPIKVYEYLAMGLPVVSFRMLQIHDYPYVFIANNEDEFITQIEKALTVHIDAKLIEDFLSVNRWEDRAREFLKWGKEILEKPDLVKYVTKY